MKLEFPVTFVREPVVYIGSPYFHQDRRIMERRFTDVMAVTADLLRRGEVAYSPIIHCHPIAAAHELSRSFDFWINLNYNMLIRCDRLYILQLDGWEHSVGLAHEIQFAEANSIPIEYLPWPK